MRAYVFNTPMTAAILNYRKNKTRRIGNGNPPRVGDVFWVREPASVLRFDDINLRMTIRYKADGQKVDMDVPVRLYDFEKDSWPRWLEKKQGIPNGCITEAARVFIRVTDVRQERLQDMPEDDVYDEGVRVIDDLYGGVRYCFDSVRGSSLCSDTKIGAFMKLWDSLAKKGEKWDDNPIIDVVTFEIIKEKEE